jgi:hypothetical protein
MQNISDAIWSGKRITEKLSTLANVIHAVSDRTFALYVYNIQYSFETFPVLECAILIATLFTKKSTCQQAQFFENSTKLCEILYKPLSEKPPF